MGSVVVLVPSPHSSTTVMEVMATVEAGMAMAMVVVMVVEARIMMLMMKVILIMLMLMMTRMLISSAPGNRQD
jgi:hypothetical protein